MVSINLLLEESPIAAYTPGIVKGEIPHWFVSVIYQIRVILIVMRL
jgi:hypothetical protein